MAGLLLAAGSGSRLGRPKALVEFGGERLVDRGVRTLHEGGCDPVMVVMGAAETEVEGVTTVRNPEWNTGMGSSVRAGLDALPGSVDAVVIALADQPLITSHAVRRLLGTRGTGARAAVATYHGNQRNPVLLGREHWSTVYALAVDDVGARPFLRTYSHLVTPVECQDVSRPDDIDTPEDLERLTGLLEGT
ncbi:4-diphosphocytidyl-2C-methyl-D-erythritol synthase [Nocardiopsis kunsanensis]|uniref:4-diphosphocytidyl-2C-methyl-D-erythritol synthase n=1 Tax=Nocardiopsis kunsanensis TaxID=141693 RepID=A0A919CED7_9ACTN|nr:nucleotidyltransferase family protein [Nocardiopsis kunsanensis]GHD15190.1 4-diphosphocytidyl-2C-methyl-D-erythritol synthase [Nocardiopsis kunsanensis]